MMPATPAQPVGQVKKHTSDQSNVYLFSYNNNNNNNNNNNFINCKWVDTRWQWSFNVLHMYGLFALDLVVGRGGGYTGSM